jgi:alpha-galactosidase
MGWNSWNLFGPHIHEDLVKGIADALVSTGMKDAGYRYLVLDDVWHGGRGADGRLFPDPAKFPQGMQALGDYLHARGLKFGLYSDAGTHTCAGMPASQGYEDVDAQTFAAWGVDYLKYDYCNAPADRASAERLYDCMGAALRKTGRPIVFSVCEWGQRRPWLWAPQVGGHLWRTTGDIWNAWEDAPDSVHAGIETIGFDLQTGLEAYAGPGRWNDPDMLVVGLSGPAGANTHVGGPGCTDAEYRTHFSLWCLLAAPLMAACDLRQLDEATRQILLNRELIAVNQDALGKQGYRVFKSAAREVWMKPLANGDLAVGLYNRGWQRVSITAWWPDLGITGPYAARDLWTHTDCGVFTQSFTAEVLPHAGMILRLAPA